MGEVTMGEVTMGEVTMGEVAKGRDQAAERRCRYCRRPLPAPARTGRPREFCTASCRQQDYVRRQRAREAGLAEHELVVTRAELDELHDLLYVLEAAVEDVDRDLQEATGADDYREALEWLLDAARPLVARRVGEPLPGRP